MPQCPFVSNDITQHCSKPLADAYFTLWLMENITDPTESGSVAGDMF